MGSSASRIDGLLTSARAIATRWRCPPESSFGPVRLSIQQIDLGERLIGALGAVLRRHAGVDERQLDVVERGRARQQVERLEDEPDLLVPDPRQLVVVHLAHLLVVQQVAALRRRVEAADEVHERRLARPGRAHDRDVFAALDGDGHAPEGMDLLRAHLVGLPKILSFNECHST